MKIVAANDDLSRDGRMRKAAEFLLAALRPTPSGRVEELVGRRRMSKSFDKALLDFIAAQMKAHKQRRVVEGVDDQTIERELKQLAYAFWSDPQYRSMTNQEIVAAIKQELLDHD